jgi:integrase
MKKDSTNASLPGLYCRNGVYQYRRVIPKPLRDLAGKRELKFSLGTDSWEVAVTRYSLFKKQADDQLSHLRVGKPLSSFDGGNSSLEAYRQISRDLGFAYKEIDELKKSPSELQVRINKLFEHGDPTNDEFGALLGVIPEDLTFDECIQEYLEITSDQTVGKSDREKRKRENPIRRAFRDFGMFLNTDFSIDKPTIKSVRRQHGKQYRQALIIQLNNKEMRGDTANKRLLHVKKVFNQIIKNRDWDFENPFSGISIDTNDVEQRPPYSVKFIQDKILANAALEGMHRECQGIVLAAIATGCGPKELVGLAPDDIQIEHGTPHIFVRANAFRQLKQPHRGRQIPLVGFGLKVFKEFPTGFLHYRSLKSGADAVSANVRKHFRKKGLIEGKACSIYSFRHSFKNQMREANTPLDAQDYLMGHKSSRMGDSYGGGYSLTKLSDFMNALPINKKN